MLPEILSWFPQCLHCIDPLEISARLNFETKSQEPQAANMDSPIRVGAIESPEIEKARRFGVISGVFAPILNAATTRKLVVKMATNATLSLR